MSIHVALNHVTHYRYDRPVTSAPQVVRLRPAPHCRTRILSLFAARSSRRKHFINWQQDPQANYLARLVFPEKTRELRVEVDLVAEMAVLNPFDFFLEPQRRAVSVRLRAEQLARAGAVSAQAARGRRASRAYLAGDRRARRSRTIDFLVDLNQRLQQRHRAT